MMELRRKVLYKRLLQISIVGVIFLFLARNLYQNWDEISTYQWNTNYYLLAISFLILMAIGFLFVLGWNLVLKGLGGHLSYRKSLKISFLSYLGKYIPGQVWSMAGKVYLCKEQGIPVSVTSASIAIITVLQLVSGLLVFLISLGFWSNVQAVNAGFKLMWIIPIGLLALHPSVMSRGLNLILTKLKRPPMRIDLKYKNILLLLLFWCCLRFIYGVASYLIIYSIYPLSIVHLPIIIGAFGIAWVVGFLTPLAPAGLGAEEITITFLLNFYMPLAIATIIAVLCRILRTLSDVVCALITCKF